MKNDTETIAGTGKGVKALIAESQDKHFVSSDTDFKVYAFILTSDLHIQFPFPRHFKEDQK
ncbi:hypothetical protein AGMMS50268_06980 [Spirochaetia bacterium]|nr:hypothetical protein AGMMS50268_06980 [Spirochaetia bacterium]